MEVVRPLLEEAAENLEALGKHAWVDPAIRAGIQQVIGERVFVSLTCQVSQNATALVFETDISTPEIRTFTKVNGRKGEIDKIETGTLTSEMVEGRVGVFIEGLG
jgi:hypothetical protein